MSVAPFQPAYLAAFQPLDPFDPSRHVLSLAAIRSQDEARVGFKPTRLADMIRLGMPVPPGETLTMELVGRLLHEPEVRPLVYQHLRDLIAKIEATPEAAGTKFGSMRRPLLVSVRSGGRQVMEGLLPSLLSVGLNDQTVQGLARLKKDPVMAYRLYLKFVIDFASVVHGVRHQDFAAVGAPENSVKKLRAQIAHAKSILFGQTGQHFLEDPYEQLYAAILAVAKSWLEPRVVDYRRRHRIPDNPPTGITVELQVHGSFGDSSAAAAVASRHFRTGAPGPFGIAKLHTTGDILMIGACERFLGLEQLFFSMSDLSAQLKPDLATLEHHYRGPVRLELVVDSNQRWYLQAGPLAAWPEAWLHIALDMHREGILSLSEMESLVAKHRVDTALASARYQRPRGTEHYLLMGESLAPGIAHGKLVQDYRALAETWRSGKGRRNGVRPKREFIFVVDHIDPQDWELILERAAGLVFTCHPGDHFLPRALQHRIPVLTPVDDVAERLAGLREGTPVWLDASREQGYLTDKRLRRKFGMVARYLRGELTDADVDAGGRVGRRARVVIDDLREYQRLTGKGLVVARPVPAKVGEVPPLGTFKMAHFIDGAPAVDPKPMVAYVVDYHRRWPIPHWFYIGELWRARDWASLSWSRDTQQDEYQLEEPAIRFVNDLFDREPELVASFMLSTPMGNHALSVAIYRCLPPEKRLALMDQMVSRARVEGLSPGWNSGLFLLSRFVALEAVSDPICSVEMARLRPETLRFLVTELLEFQLVQVNPNTIQNAAPELCAAWQDYDRRRHGTAGPTLLVRRRYQDSEYADETLQRYPGLKQDRWLPFLQALPSTLWEQVLFSPELSYSVRGWFAGLVGLQEQWTSWQQSQPGGSELPGEIDEHPDVHPFYD